MDVPGNLHSQVPGPAAWFVRLGATGINVSRLCLGTLTASPLQLDLRPGEAADLYHAAWRQGVSFFDTAKLYSNYEGLALLLDRVPRSSVVIASKSYASSAEEMRSDVASALDALGTDYVDLFLLHEQESALTLRGHRAALLELAELKRSGAIRAAGISTHTVAGVRAASLEPLLDVIHAPVNTAGLGIADGTLADMLDALRSAFRLGKGIYAMKPLGGGHLGGQAADSLAFTFGIPYIHAVALGVGSKSELDFALAGLSGRPPVPAVAADLASTGRRILIDPWCEGCGRCVVRCPQRALTITGGRAVVDVAACVLCGYCAAACPGFNIKVVRWDRENSGARPWH